jgi:hypothetical protein
MSTMPEHPADEQLQAFLGDRNGAPGVREHLESCPHCRETFRVLARVDSALRTMPRERTGADFTRVVMDRVGAGSSSALVFRMLGGAAQVFALFAVLGIMTGVFLFAGIIDVDQVQQGSSAVQQMMQRVGGEMEGTLLSFNAGLRNLLPFFFGGKSGTISLLVILVACALAVADRLLGRNFRTR